MTRSTNTRLLTRASNGFAELFEPRQGPIDAGAGVTFASIKGV
mgnify:CR=1 FL=1